LLNQVEIDSEFLRKNRIVDYSFLIGIHKIEKNKEDQKDLQEHKVMNENRCFDSLEIKSDRNIELVEHKQGEGVELENYSISTGQVISETESESLLLNKEFQHPFKDVS
jgi:hypothetical protein